MDLINKLEHSKNKILTTDEIQKFIKDIEEKIKKMENEVKTYTIDRFEENIAVCEDRSTKEIINIDKKELPNNINEGDIIEYRNGNYYKNEESQKNIEDRIKKKMDDLWN